MSNAKWEMQNVIAEFKMWITKPHEIMREMHILPRDLPVIRILNSAFCIVHLAFDIWALAFCTSQFAFLINNHMILITKISKSSFRFGIPHLAIRMILPAFHLNGNIVHMICLSKKQTNKQTKQNKFWYYFIANSSAYYNNNKQGHICYHF